MAQSYTVKHGDHISSIAEEFKFRDYKNIWDDGSNASLKQLRSNPDVLNPGDTINIPDKKKREESCATGKTHVFEVRLINPRLRIRFLNVDGDPRTEKDVDVDVESKVERVKTDGGGIATRHKVPRNAHQGKVLIETDGFQIGIGALDDVDSPKGQQARLLNLGYYRGTMDSVDEMEFRSAVEEFQCDRQLKVTGVCDAETQAQLKSEHGC
jgi:hypothetical protein